MIKPTLPEELRDLVVPRPHVPESFERVVLPMDKAQGWSSFDVVKWLRYRVPVRKVGHAGTLDPMATGLLLCLVGRATKAQRHFMELEKEYTGTLRLGEVTPSYDADTEVTERKPWQQVSEADLHEARQQFVGEIVQRAPMYSAVKVEGERLYKKARRGEQVERPPRQVSVYEFELGDRDGQDVSFTVRCSRGTYVRSLAHDLGQALGCGAHLVALRRTAIGPFRVEEAWTTETLKPHLEAHEHTP